MTTRFVLIVKMHNILHQVEPEANVVVIEEVQVQQATSELVAKDRLKASPGA